MLAYDQLQGSTGREVWYRAPRYDARKLFPHGPPRVELGSALHRLQDRWLAALSQLQWRAGESDDEYKSRVVRPYDEFDGSIATIRTSLAAAETRPAPAKSAKPRKAVARAKAKTR